MKKDWLSSPQDIRAKVPLLLDRYGLAGWRIHVVIGGPDMIWKTLPLATEDAADARELITGADLLDEEGRAYGFDLACPEKNRDGLYDWVSALIRPTVSKPCADPSSMPVPSWLPWICCRLFLGRLQPEGEGILSSKREGPSIESTCKRAAPRHMNFTKGSLCQKGLQPLAGRKRPLLKVAPCRRQRLFLRSWNDTTVAGDGVFDSAVRGGSAREMQLDTA